jgi:hypothetical protein
MHSGYVAFLDVLGFSSLVANDRDGDLINEYLAALSTALKPESGTVGQNDYLVFSDSIVVTSLGGEPDHLRQLVRSCSYLFGELLKRGIAMRGAISYGQYLSNSTGKGRFVAGKAIVEAYSFEERQDWVGIMLAPSVVKHFKTLPTQSQLSHIPARPQDIAAWVGPHAETSRFFAAYVQPCNEIPFHSEPGGPINYAGYAIVPTSGDYRLRSVSESLRQSIAQLETLKIQAPDPIAQRKYDRTLKWLRGVASHWHEAFSIASNVTEPQLRGLLTPHIG